MNEIDAKPAEMKPKYIRTGSRYSLYMPELRNIIDDNMNNEKEGHTEKKMQMWKMKQEMLNSMSDKELRAFIKGYMMGQRTVFKQLSAMNGCECGSCQCGSSCKNESCGCGSKDCNCGKE